VAAQAEAAAFDTVALYVVETRPESIKVFWRFSLEKNKENKHFFLKKEAKTFINLVGVLLGLPAESGGVEAVHAALVGP
jgi:hypothetical protein